MQDDNRYNSSWGAHLNLKRTEKAPIRVSKIAGTCLKYKQKHSLWTFLCIGIWKSIDAYCDYL